MKNAEPEKDYYSVLGAEEEDARGDIERRYKNLARSHHPDRGGDEEEMKSINEAWRVLGNEESRRIYDAGRTRRHETHTSHVPASSPSARADALSGRIAGALLCLVLGLALLFLVRFQYVLFLWPLALLAAFITLFGVMMAHAALRFVREGRPPGHFAHRTAWAQEAAFWSCVCAGIYAVYLLMTMV